MTAVAVVIVNYGTPGLTIDAVESVRRLATSGRPVTVHVVDNASPGDDAAQIAAAHDAGGWGDGVRLWPETVNHGFGLGNNVVLDKLVADPDAPPFVLLLNPDAQLQSDAVDLLARTLEAHPEAGAAGAAIVDETGTPVSAAFRFPTLRSEMLRVAAFSVLDAMFPRQRVSLPPDHPAGEVGWLSGAAVMFRVEALRAVGTFDPAFFLYFEEVELMHRMARAGWTRRHVPEAKVLHDEGSATGAAEDNAAARRLPAYRYASWTAYFRLTRGRGGALAVALALLPAALFHHLHRRIRGKRPGLPAHFIRDHWHHAVRPLLSGGRANG